MERTVKVRLLAMVNGFVGGMAEAKKSISEARTEMQKMSEERRATFTDIGGGMAAVGAAMLGAAGLAIKRFADFDEQMSYVEATTRESAGAMNLLRAAALQAGQDTVFTAVESAAAVNELAKAGVSTSDILGGGLTAALDLAASSGMGVARAAEVMAGGMGMFRLAGSDAAQVADLLSAGANKSIGEVDDLALALRQVGPVANLTGLSIQETVGTLAAFASTGRIGLDAGTSFKRMLQLLTPQSAAAAAEMERLGISGYDLNGEFIGMVPLADNLKTSLQGLTDEQRNAALSTIFGSDAIAAASELYRLGGEGVEEWIDKVNDSGYASENAALRLGNLKGDIEQFGGALDTALVNAGSNADGPLRSLVQGATDLVNAYSNASDTMQGSVFWIVAVTGGIALLGGAFFLAVPRIAAYNEAVGILTRSMPRLGAAISAVGKVGGWVAVFVTAFAAIQTWSDTVKESLRMNASELNNLVTTSTSGANTLKNVLSGMSEIQWTKNDNKDFRTFSYGQKEIVENFGMMTVMLDNYNKSMDEGQWWKKSSQFEDFGTRIEGLGQSLSELAATDLPAAQKSFSQLAEQTDGSKEQIMALLNTMPAYRDTVVDLASTLGIDATNAQQMMNLAMGEGQEGAASQAVQLGELSAAASDTSGEVQDLADQIANFGKATFDTRGAQQDFNSALLDLQENFDAATEAGIAQTDMLNLNTKEGIANNGALDSLASKTNQYAAAVWSQTGSLQQTTAALDAGRAKLREWALQMGYPIDQVDSFVDSLIATPTSISTQVNVVGIPSAEAVLDHLTRTRSVQINAIINRGADPLPQSGGTTRPGFALGGAISGPGTGTSDTAGLFRLSNGEHVLTAREVAAMGGQAGVYAFRRSIRNGGSVTDAPLSAIGSQGSSQVAAVSPVVSSAPAMVAGGSAPMSTTVNVPETQIVVKIDGRGVALGDLIDAKIDERDSKRKTQVTNGKARKF